MKKVLVVLAVIIFVFGVNSQVGAAPIKWSQPPDWDYGYDILSNVKADGSAEVVADDWLCENGLPITDIHWWGSYQGDTDPNVPIGAPSPAMDFWIGVWSDVPADQSATGYSHPGILLGAGEVFDLVGYKNGYQQYTQHNGYKYEIDISDDPILQDAGTIYWLSIVATGSVGEDYWSERWGWKTSYTHNIDCAVKGLVADEPLVGIPWLETVVYMEPLGVDMAFELTTIPELGTMILLGSLATGLFGFAGLRRKK
ncbi:MAG: hypothetical protein KAU12_00860 [Candidatus Omnitrophica bacterium]|nr:hypothetical protein [Candidatus Omnitrophota bacterium]